MKFSFLLLLALVFVTSNLASPENAEAKGRKGSHRVGGRNSKGKGSHYRGGTK